MVIVIVTVIVMTMIFCSFSISQISFSCCYLECDVNKVALFNDTHREKLCFS